MASKKKENQTEVHEKWIKYGSKYVKWKDIGIKRRRNKE